MIAGTLIFGVKIKLQNAVSASNESDVGLYDDADNGAFKTFRWINSNISPYSPTYAWKPGIVHKSGISPIKEEMPNPFEGGNFATIDGGSITALNSLRIGGTVSPFDKYLKNNEIFLYNLMCEITYFQISGGSLVDPDGTIVYRGTITSIYSDVSNLTFDITSPYINRSVDVGIQINSNTGDNPPAENINKKIDATMGTNFLEYDSDKNLTWGGAARAEKISGVSNQYTTSYTMQMGPDLYLNMYHPDDHGLRMFPVTGSTSTAPLPGRYSIKLGAGVGFWNDGLGLTYVSGVYILSALSGKVLNVVDGAGNGQSVEIRYATVNLNGAPSTLEIDIDVKNFLFTSLVGNSTATESENSWVEILDARSTFKVDDWTLKSFIDENQNNIETGIRLFTFDNILTNNPDTNNVSKAEKEFRLLSSFNTTKNVYNNEIDLGASSTLKEIVTSEDFAFVPPTKISYFAPDWAASAFGISEADRFNLEYLERSIFMSYGFSNSSLTYRSAVSVNPGSTAPNDSNTTDGAGGFSYTITDPPFVGMSSRSDITCCLKIEIPQNIEFDFSNVYVGFRCNVDTTNLTTKLLCYVRSTRFLGPAVCSRDTAVDGIDSATEGNINNFPDGFYSSNATDTYDLYFYNDSENYSYSSKKISSGINLFKIDDISDKNIYKNTKYVYVFVCTENTKSSSTDAGTCNVSIQNISMVYKKSQSISNTVFTSIKGRIFSDSWGLRKNPSTLIENPVDMIEHFKRLGNWQEVLATSEFGKEYATGALISTTNFDSSDLDHARNTKPSFQISDTLNNIVKHLCHDFWLNSHIDLNSGNELLTPVMRKAATAPTLTLNYADFIGKIGKTMNVNTKHIFPKIVVKYAFNNATDKYDKQISIDNPNQAAYDSSYVVGLSGSQAELFWNMSKILFDVVKKTEDPPTYMQELRTVYRDEDAVDYISKWYSIMGIANTDGTVSGLEFDPKELLSGTLPLMYMLDYHRSDHINIQLDHQTESTVVECEILAISKNIENSTASVQLVQLGYQDTINYFIQEITSNTEPNWIETTSSQSTHGEGADITEEA